MTTTRTAASAALALAAACAAPQGEASWSVEAVRESTELDRVDVESPDGSPKALRNQKRRRTGVQVGYGTERVGVEVEVFHEDFVGDHDGHGLSIGVAGAPTLHRFGTDSTLTLPYRARLSAVDGGALRTGGVAGDYSYGEAHLEVGVGWRRAALQPSIGLAVDSLRGTVAYDDATNTRRALRTSCTAGFVDLRYRPTGTGFSAGLRALIGEEQGARWSLGWRF